MVPAISTVDDHEASAANRMPAVAQLDNWIDSERERLPLLVPVFLGLGIAAWQWLGSAVWPMLAVFCLGLLLVGIAVGLRHRPVQLLLAAQLLFVSGFAIISLKSTLLGAQPLERPWLGSLTGRIEAIENVAARGIVRYRLAIGQQKELPPTIRVNVEQQYASPEFRPGAIIALKVRLMPPPGPALPGGYDFARTAWFDGLGATGRAIGPAELIAPAEGGGNLWNSMRNQFASRIDASMRDGTGAVGAALLVGARGGIDDEDSEALRNSGMAHLLSVSGLHVTAVVGGTFLLAASLFALWPWFALRVQVPLVAAALSAAIAVFYTLLTGAEVPTVRACIAALLILVALAMGREALSLRLLAAGATFVLLFWPEALAGPSFQLSFAAVATIVVLHGSEGIRKVMQVRDEGLFRRLGRGFIGLLLTGLAIEMVLAPIALFHFHKSGLYGALANIAAIPLTTFVIMPAQLLGLFGDLIVKGIGTPFWWIASEGVALILKLAHLVSNSPGAVALLPEMPGWAFMTYVLSILALAIFRFRARWWVLVPLALASIAMLIAPRPDMLLTGDGQHLAVVLENGKLAMLRPKAGDYARSILGETAAVKEDAIDLDTMPGALCNPDGCSFTLKRGGRVWRILAFRSGYLIPAMELAAACRRVDIVISNRRLPWSCRPSWIKADAVFLQRSGGIAFYLLEARTTSVAEENAHLPWSAYAPQRIKAREEEWAKKRAAKQSPPPIQNLEPNNQ